MAQSSEPQVAANNIPPTLEVTYSDDKSNSASNSVGGGLRKENSDTKSVTSRTTLTLDEKDSLRPDDSASMQAAIEEDIPSPPSSVVAESKEEPDPDAQAFRDQLRQISLTGDPGVIMPHAQRPVGLGAAVEQRTGVLAFQAAAPEADFVPIHQPEIIRPRVTDSQMWIVPADEKLLEALASPKDRLFVLKVEQDLIDFIKDPKYVQNLSTTISYSSDTHSREDFLQLPGTNSFYRMLSHKLADYYMLGHLVDDSMSSVRIFRTPTCRLPPPLIGSTPTTTGSTPPPSAPARKIMRRNGEQGTPDRAQPGDFMFDSLTSSKAPSDTGSNSGNVRDGRPQSKGRLTREERENRYKETRARIFKDFEGKEIKEGTTAAADDPGISRSSSTSGGKKNRKQRKPKDDGFEARSAFDSLGRRISEHAFPQPPADMSTYGQYYTDVHGNMIPVSSGLQSGQGFSVGSYPVASFQGSNGLQGHGMSIPSMQSGRYGMGSPNVGQEGFGMMNYEGNQFSAMMSQERTPKGTAPTLSGNGYNQHYPQQGWSPNEYTDPCGLAGYHYSDYNSGYQQHHNGQMMQQSMSPGNYSGFSLRDAQNYNQAYFAKAFSNQHFNPQSQTFVPNMSGGHGQQYDLGQNGAGYVSTPTGFPVQPQSYKYVTASQAHANGNARAKSKQPNLVSKWPTPASLPAKPPAVLSPSGQRSSQTDLISSLPVKPISTR